MEGVVGDNRNDEEQISDEFSTPKPNHRSSPSAQCRRKVGGWSYPGASSRRDDSPQLRRAFNCARRSLRTAIFFGFATCS
jgi:hypothetical protein